MKKLYQLFDRSCGTPWFPLIFVLISVVFLLFYSFSTSPLFLNDGMDSAVFKTMGLAVLKGKVLYVDIFDHKGPVLYFINALGQWLIPGRLGIFLLQVIGLSVSLLYMFRISRLFVNNALSLFAVLLTLFIFGGIIQEGNQCEEWMMYFFCIAFYYVLVYFVRKPDKQHPLKYSFVYGFCFAVAFFIRPNDAVGVVGGIMMGLTIWLIYKKDFKGLALNVLCFMGGAAVVTIPVLCYFAYHHALGDLWYGLIGFNKGYSGGVKQLIISVFQSEKTALALVFISLVLLVREVDRYRIILFVLCPVISIEWIMMGSSYFHHYYISILPIYLLYLLFVILLLVRKQKKWNLIVLSVGILFLSAHVGTASTISLSTKSIIYRLVTFAHGRSYYRIYDFYAETDSLLSIIPKNEIDSVWNYNLKWSGGGVSNCSAFSSLWHKGIVQCNLITYGSSADLRKKDDLSVKKPLWIVLDGNEIDEKNDIKSINYISSYYRFVAKTDTTICNLNLYRRK